MALLYITQDERKFTFLFDAIREMKLHLSLQQVKTGTRLFNMLFI